MLTIFANLPRYKFSIREIFWNRFARPYVRLVRFLSWIPQKTAMDAFSSLGIWSTIVFFARGTLRICFSWIWSCRLYLLGVRDTNIFMIRRTSNEFLSLLYIKLKNKCVSIIRILKNKVLRFKFISFNIFLEDTASRILVKVKNAYLMVLLFSCL